MVPSAAARPGREDLECGENQRDRWQISETEGQGEKD